MRSANKKAGGFCMAYFVAGPDAKAAAAARNL